MTSSSPDQARGSAGPPGAHRGHPSRRAAMSPALGVGAAGGVGATARGSRAPRGARAPHPGSPSRPRPRIPPAGRLRAGRRPHRSDGRARRPHRRWRRSDRRRARWRSPRWQSSPGRSTSMASGTRLMRSPLPRPRPPNERASSSPRRCRRRGGRDRAHRGKRAHRDAHRPDRPGWRRRPRRRSGGRVTCPRGVVGVVPSRGRAARRRLVRLTAVDGRGGRRCRHGVRPDARGRDAHRLPGRLVGAVAGSLVGLLAAIWLVRARGGLDGDALGATIELSFAAILLSTVLIP